MALTTIVTVSISLSSPAITQDGFGIPLIPSATATWPERTRTYTTLSGVTTDFPSPAPEFFAAEVAFGQNPSIPKIMIGRLANIPTKKQVVSVASVKASTAYVVNAFSGGVLQTATYTTPGSGETNDTIVAGIVAAVNALAAPALVCTAVATGSSGTMVCTITGNAAGNYFDIEVIDFNLLAVAETEADPGIATDLDAILDESSAWYGLVLLFKSQAIILAAAAWIESNNRLFIVASSDTAIATVSFGSATDVMHALVTASRTRTGPAFHPRNYEFMDVAEVGRWFAINPGSDNWTYKPLSGVTPGIGPTNKSYTGTHITNLTAKHCNYYDQLVQGAPIVLGKGRLCDNSFGYIDARRFLDWYVNDLSVGIVNAEIELEKIPYTDDGVAIIEGIVRTANKAGVAAGGIAPTPIPTVTAPLVASVDPTQKAERNLPKVDAIFELAGAIDTIQVQANVSV